MPSSKTYDYLALLIAALCAYLLATVGTHKKLSRSSSSSSSTTSSSSGGIVWGPRTDKATGISFAATQDFTTGKALTLVGVGTRKKAILNIYSLGVYVAKPLLQQFSTAERCTAIIHSKSPKAVQLTFAMGIGPEKIAEAVSGLKDVDPTVRQEFHDMLIQGLGGGKMLKGESMTFEWKGLDSISVTARGKKIGTMKHKDLAKGVLSLYVGPQSVSPSLLHDLHCR
mmetsp:Transcript_99122/g.284823  ORF Transcript_99122/g.284823 Transcript_99122/m.284823 type:complete len:226 (+) Transcript_99122:127-804(+)